VSSERAWRLTLAGTCIVAALASLSFSGMLPTEVTGFMRSVCGAPVLLLLAALPVLVLVSPVEPSWLKLAVLSGLLSPCWIAAWYLAGRLFMTTDAALTLAFATTAVCAPLAARRRVGAEAIGRPALCVLLLSAALVLGVGMLLAGLGSAGRLLQPGVVWHAGVAQALGRGLLENPWLAGTELPTHPAFALLGLLFARSLDLTEPAALAAINLWSLALLPTLLYLWAAPLWREPRRVLATPILALLGWNALGGLSPWGALEGSVSWTAWLGQATPGVGQGHALYGLAGWLSPGPWVPALTLATGAWMCAAHALRHGGRPWVGLCAVLHGAAALVDPSIGAAALLATCAGALLLPGVPSVRPKLTLALLFAALPAVAMTRVFSPWAEPVRPLVDWPGPLALLVPGGLFLPMAMGLVIAGPGRRRTGLDRTLLVLAGLAIIAPLCLPFTALQNHLRSAEFTRTASFPLALLAAGGLFDWIDRGGWRAALGLVLGLAMVVGSARNVVHVLGGFRALASPGDSEPTSNSARNLALCYEWLRSATELRSNSPILVREVSSARDRLGTDLAPHPAAFETDLPMWCDVLPELSPNSPRWKPRNAQVQALFNERKDWNPRVAGEWSAIGRTLVFVVEESDRRRTHKGDHDVAARGVELRLARLGARLARRFGDVAVYVFGDG